MVLPDQAGHLLRVGATTGSVSKICTSRCLSYAGQPGSPLVANAVHAARIWADTASACGEVVAEQHGGLAAGQVAEDERHVQAVAGAEDATHARRGQVSS